MGKPNPFGSDIVPPEVKEMIARSEKERKERMERQRRDNIRDDYRSQSGDLDSFALGMTTGVVTGPQSGMGAAVYWGSHSGHSDQGYSSSSDSSSSSSDSSSSSFD